MDALLALALAILAGLLIFPLFRVEHLDNWGSIDSTFIADARFLVEHWPRPRWQPLWYCGTRFDYIYPPMLRYGTAGLAILSGVSTARAYHIYTGILYCAGIAGVWLLARTLGFRRSWAAVAAAAAAVLSPSFLILASYRQDAALHMPQRLNVLLKWGEGPHISALALLPFALLFTWRALRGGAPAAIVLAALFSALVVGHNFYGACSLAVLFGLAVWSIGAELRERTVAPRAAAIVVLSYGFSAWWLTPSYVRITVENLKLVAQPGNSWSRWVAAAVAIGFGALTWRLARSRKCGAPALFLAGGALSFGLVVIGHYYAGFRVVGEPHRFVPELDLVLILALAALLQRLSASAGRKTRWAAILAVVAAFAASYPYLSAPWSIFVSDPDYRRRPEYRMTEWIAAHLPGSRVFATGSLRFWYDAWKDGAQVGGGSDQGLLNGTLSMVQWQVIRDAAAGRDIAWLKAVGADAIAVHQPPSAVIFFEYTDPRKFAGVLPAIFDDGNGDVLYAVPRRFPSRARIVNLEEIERLGPIPVSNENRADIEAYVRAVEEGPAREVEMRRDAPESIVLRARLDPGEALLVQESYDPAWRAYAAGRVLPISKDAAGFMLVHAPPGGEEIRLMFETPLENRIGGVLTLLSVIAALLFARPRRWHR